LQAHQADKTGTAFAAGSHTFDRGFGTVSIDRTAVEQTIA
jgi:hypothetical protein